MALAVLTTRHFHPVEGGGEIRDLYVDLRLRRGAQWLRNEQPQSALDEFLAAHVYPSNLEIAEPYRNPRRAEVAYHIGLAQEALGDSAAARESFEQAAAAAPEVSEATYYRALALRKLHRHSEADSLCDRLIEAGKVLKDNAAADYFAKFGERQSDCERQTRASHLQYLGQHARIRSENAG